jgi:hypothetical protein
MVVVVHRIGRPVQGDHMVHGDLGDPRRWSSSANRRLPQPRTTQQFSPGTDPANAAEGVLARVGWGGVMCRRLLRKFYSQAVKTNNSMAFRRRWYFWIDARYLSLSRRAFAGASLRCAMVCSAAERSLLSTVLNSR